MFLPAEVQTLEVIFGVVFARTIAKPLLVILLEPVITFSGKESFLSEHLLMHNIGFIIVENFEKNH